MHLLETGLKKRLQILLVNDLDCKSKSAGYFYKHTTPKGLNTSEKDFVFTYITEID